jgi:S-adenosylmethionine hydrolase
MSSNTFHGRDIFAPAAAHASLGVPGEKFGDPLSKLETLPIPRLDLIENGVQGQVLTKDRFGNLFTSIGQFWYQDQSLSCRSWITNLEISQIDSQNLKVGVHNLRLPVVSTFASVNRGDCAGLIGSTGLLEIIANQGSAASILELKPGDPVSLTWQA